MFTVLRELLTLLFIVGFGGQSARRELARARATNNRDLAALHAHHVASGLCFDRTIAEWNEQLYPGYRAVLNQERSGLGLPAV
jgi:hypothetical protein